LSENTIPRGKKGGRVTGTKGGKMSGKETASSHPIFQKSLPPKQWFFSDTETKSSEFFNIFFTRDTKYIFIGVHPADVLQVPVLLIVGDITPHPRATRKCLA